MSTETTPLPDGQYARWQERTWEASPVATPRGSVTLFSPTQADPEFRETPTERWARVLPQTDVELFRLATYCRWKGARFRVEGRTADGRLQLGYLGRSEDEATALGLTKAQPGVFVTTVPESEVTDLEQVRTPI